MECPITPNQGIVTVSSMASQSSEQVSFLLLFGNYIGKNLFPKSIKGVKKTRKIVYAVTKFF